MSKDKSIQFVATVYKVQTLVDGGLRVTLDLAETAIGEAAALMECKRNGVALDVSCEVSSAKTWTELDDETGKGAERKTSRVGRRRA